MNIVVCELCCKGSLAPDMLLFIYKAGSIVHTNDRSWEGKSGVRHLCKACAATISEAVKKVA